MFKRQWYAISFLWLISGYINANIVPDGSSNTQVVVEPSGRSVINIAPADSNRVSHNRYAQFDIGSQGAILNNSTANARTIINEVSSHLPSLIAGEIRVQGARAHVIIANPNGISVDGAEVFNMASLALTTGSIGYRQQIDEFGVAYQNPIVSVNEGQVRIGAGGLSGSINRLELLSRSFIAEGSIKNDSESAFATLNLRIGAGEHEFNSRQTIADPAGAWVVSEMNSTEESKIIAIDISSDANLYASRINIMVTDLGAGVRSAGNLYAIANDFTLHASGRVEISGDIQSALSVDIQAREIYSNAKSGSQNIIESQYSSVTIKSDTDIYLESTLVSAVINNDIDESALRLIADGEIRLMSRNVNERSILFSLHDLSINSDLLYNNSSRIIANSGIDIKANFFENSVLIDEFDSQGILINSNEKGKRLWYMAFIQREDERKRTINFGEPKSGRISSEILTGKGDISIAVKEYQGVGGNIIANDGNINIQADVVLNEAAVVGRADMSVRCGLGGCDKRGTSNVDLLGGNIQASKKLNIVGHQQIMNRGGTLQAVEEITLSTVDSRTEAIRMYDVLTRNKGLRGLLLKKDGLWISVDQGGAIVSNMGRINIEGSELQVIGGRLESPLEVNGEFNVVREPTTQDLLLRRTIGLGRGIL